MPPKYDTKSAKQHEPALDSPLQFDSPSSSVFQVDLPRLGPSTEDPHLKTSPSSVATTIGGVPDSTRLQSSLPSFVVISGGTGGNAICSAFCNACYVLPVSDDGGSSSEIIRVLGGPSIGAHSSL
jgi:hypothetical protein